MNFLDRLILSVSRFRRIRKVFVILNSRVRHLSLVEKMLVQRGKILEIGCGLGLNCDYFKNNGYSVCGIDVDNELIEKTKVYSSADLRTGSAVKIPFPDSTFDAVVYMFVLHHIPPFQHKKVLGETFRVLKKNGVMILVEPMVTSRRDLLFDKFFFPRSFYNYFTVDGRFEQNIKGKTRFFSIKQANIRGLKFGYKDD